MKRFVLWFSVSCYFFSLESCGSGSNSVTRNPNTQTPATPVSTSSLSTTPTSSISDLEQRTRELFKKAATKLDVLGLSVTKLDIENLLSIDNETEFFNACCERTAELCRKSGQFDDAGLRNDAIKIFEELIMWHIQNQENGRIGTLIYFTISGHFYCYNENCKEEPYVSGDCAFYSFKRYMYKNHNDVTDRTTGVQAWKMSVMELRQYLYSKLTVGKLVTRGRSIDITNPQEYIELQELCLLFNFFNTNPMVDYNYLLSSHYIEFSDDAIARFRRDSLITTR